MPFVSFVVNAFAFPHPNLFSVLSVPSVVNAFCLLPFNPPSAIRHPTSHMNNYAPLVHCLRSADSVFS